MKTLFQYNWQVRDEWFQWCKDSSEQELLQPRIGGVGGILQTLFHVVAVEYCWVYDLIGRGRPDIEDKFEQYATLSSVMSLSEQFHPEVRDFVMSLTDTDELRTLSKPHRLTGETEVFLHGEILRHMVAHEIHHIGQLSVWAREIGREPITANFLRRGLSPVI